MQSVNQYYGSGRPEIEYDLEKGIIIPPSPLQKAIRSILHGTGDENWIGTTHKTVTLLHALGFLKALLSGQPVVGIVFAASLYLDRLTSRAIVDLGSFKQQITELRGETLKQSRNNSGYQRLNKQHLELIESQREMIAGLQNAVGKHETNNAWQMTLISHLETDLAAYETAINKAIESGKEEKEAAIASLHKMHGMLSSHVSGLHNFTATSKEDLQALHKKINEAEENLRVELQQSVKEIKDAIALSTPAGTPVKKLPGDDEKDDPEALL